MMSILLIPAVIGTLSGISGASGLVLSIKGVVDSVNTSAASRQVQERNEKNMLRFEACSQKLETSLQELGEQRMIISKNFNVFIHAFEEIHNAPEFSKQEQDEFPTFDFEEIKKVAVEVSVIVGMAGGVCVGSFCGAAAAAGTNAAVMALGTASTGAKISGLSGAAKTKAALAALGGGAKAVGGGGMALGSLMLNLASAGVAVLVEGIALAYAGSLAQKELEKTKKQLEENEEIISKAIDMQITIMHLINEIKSLSVTICNGIYKKLVFQLKDLVSKKKDYNLFTDAEKQLVGNNILLVQILNYLNNIPLYTPTKYNSAGEIEEVEPNFDEVKNAITLSKNKIEGIER